jgi:N-methylhydantoinase A/oxoprolinase/acetone carboxylase beta subunit
MTPNTTKYVIYIDTGGTFTDCCIVTLDGDVIHGKAHTTPQDLSICFFNAIEAAAQKLGRSMEEVLSQCHLVGYGTTQGTNVVVTGTGAPNLGLITTMGHEDRTLIGRLRAAGLTPVQTMHLVTADKASPLIPRQRIRGVIERIDQKGKVIIPLREDSVRQAVRELLEQNVAGIAVCLLWSFLNPVHERRVREIIRDMAPEVKMTLSYEAAPRIREYPRFMSTIIDLYVGLPLHKLLDEIGSKLRQKGYTYPFLIMQAAGGLASAKIVKPVTTLHSGPVGGLTGVDFWRNVYGTKVAIGTDVGGTSFDVSISSAGEEEYLREPIVGRYEISSPMRQIMTIGAGGGTKARFDQLTKRLIVGPASAEAVPGPACYGLGGKEPTITDADLVMNRINADYFLGGKVKLNKELAVAVIKEKIAEPMGIEVPQAAEAMCNILDGQMEALLQRVVALKGIDPNECPTLAFGGMGPTHCAGYTANVGFKRVIISPHAAIFSAYGASTADVKHRYEASPFFIIPSIPYDNLSLRFKIDQLKSMDELPPDMVERFNRMFAEIDQRVTEDMFAEGFKKEEMHKRYDIEARYGGQLWELRCEIPTYKIESIADFGAIIRAFEEEYIKTYTKLAMVPSGGFQAMSIAVVATGRTIKPGLRKFSYVGPHPPRPHSERDVFFKNRWVSTKVYRLEDLQCGNMVNGPAIIEAPDTTVVVPEERKVSVDEYFNVIMEFK